MTLEEISGKFQVTRSELHRVQTRICILKMEPKVKEYLSLLLELERLDKSMQEIEKDIIEYGQKKEEKRKKMS